MADLELTDRFHAQRQLPGNSNLNRLYTSEYGGGAFGAFREVGANSGGTWICCPKSGNATLDGGGKIDYFYVSVFDWLPLSVTVGNSAYSDHKLLTAYVDY